MFETNNSIHLHRRNHERCKQASLASHSERGGFCNIGSCGCLHTYNCLYRKRYSATQNLPMMPVYIRGSVRERRSKAQRLFAVWIASREKKFRLFLFLLSIVRSCQKLRVTLQQNELNYNSYGRRCAHFNQARLL